MSTVSIFGVRLSDGKFFCITYHGVSLERALCFFERDFPAAEIRRIRWWGTARPDSPVS